jgi:hypothetical protein
VVGDLGLQRRGLLREERPRRLHDQQHQRRRNDDGSFTVQFGGCDDATANCLPIFPGWNYAVRLYLPRQEVIDGTWTFPAAEAVSIGKS